MKRNLMKAMAVLLSVIFVGGMLSACGAAQPESEQAEQSEPEQTEQSEPEQAEQSEQTEQKLIAIHQPAEVPYCIAIAEGAAAALEKAGYKAEIKYGDWTVEGQMADIEDIITSGADALIVFPMDSSAIRSSIELCQTEEVPVFIVDNPFEDESLVVSNITTDNYQAGVESAEQMIADIGTEGKIVILDMPANNAVLDRENGFNDTLKDKAPDMEVAATFDYNSDQTVAMKAVEDILQSNSDINAIFAGNEYGAFGAVAALEAAGLTDQVKIYTVDGSSEGVTMVQDGKIAGIAAQQPGTMGEIAAEKVAAYFGGEEIEKKIPVDIEYLTKENASEWKGY